VDADKNKESKNWAHVVSDRNKDSIGKWIRAHSYYILTKNLSTFCPCPETLRRLTLKVMD
jgi:hypothetical protein